MTHSGSYKVKSAVVNHLQRIANATERVLLGPLTPQVRTPHRNVFFWDRCTLRHYLPIHPVSGPPLLIIPPLMVDPVIFDLRAGHSFVGHLLEQGIDVYLLDLGVPDQRYKEVTLDDYIFDFIEPAFEKVIDLSGSNRAFIYGWSMGGIMSYIFSSLYTRPDRIAGLITSGSPVDYSKMFPFHILATLLQLPLAGLLNVLGNVPAPLIRLSFRLISPIGSVLRYGELVANYHDREWVAAYESIDNWVGGLLPYAQKTFSQFIEECIIEDKLKKDQLKIGGRLVSLKNVECPILAFMGSTDKLAPTPAVEPVRYLINSGDFTLLEVPMGHIGMVAGRRAPKHVWEPISKWIEARSNNSAS